MGATAYRAVYRGRKARKTGPFQRHAPPWSLPRNHRELDGVAASAGALEGCKPILPAFPDGVHLLCLKGVGQIVYDDDRVSTEQAINADKGAVPQPYEYPGHYLQVHDSEEWLFCAEAYAFSERSTCLAIASIVGRERVGQADAPLREFRVRFYTERH